MKEWNLVAFDDKLISKLADELNVSSEIAKLLVKRGITNYSSAKDFFRPNLKNTHDPFLMKGMDEAVDRLNKAKRLNEKVLVYGDYDVDGTTSISMMCLFFESQGIEYVYYTPDRYEEGYGISRYGIDFAVNNNVNF